MDIPAGFFTVNLSMPKYQKFFMWIGTPQEMKGQKLVCGGKEHKVSDPSGDFFVSCDQSSFNGEP